MLLTHAHIDHSGLLPKLTHHGYKGPIFATAATVDLCSVMLPDSAFIQEMEVENLNRRNRQRGREPVTPIYTRRDVDTCLSQFNAVAYEQWFDVGDGVRARFWNAGHLLGSASIEVETSGAKRKQDRLRLLFSGDIGPDFKLLQRDPEAPDGFDYVVCEATYGGRDRADHTPKRRRQRLAEEVNAAARRGGALLIPSFAVERTQELVTDLITIMDEGAAPRARIFIDSPLALKASQVFIRHAHELELGDELRGAFESKWLHTSQSVEESKSINRLGGFFIVIAASGMCDAGRIRHHLKNRLWRSDTTVLMVGYQAEGTVGRLLLDGTDKVRIHGDTVAVKATIRLIDDYSGHADGPELVRWLEERRPVRRGLFLVHAESDASQALKDRLSNWVFEPEKVIVPAIDDVFTLGPSGARRRKTNVRRRIAPGETARLDWNNELTKLILDINDTVEKAAGAKERNVIIRRLRRALRR